MTLRRSHLARTLGDDIPEPALPPSVPAAAELGNAEFARRELAAVREPVTRRMLVEAVWRASWPHDRLVLGASRLIREADAWVPGKKISVHSNRGLAGIDGTIATGVGVALGSEDDGTTRVLLGDLAALHDVGALAFGVGETAIQVIVGNDGGGTIFDSLEVAASAPQDALDRVLLTSQTVSFEALAAAYGWTYLRATNRGELDQALTASTGPTPSRSRCRASGELRRLRGCRPDIPGIRSKSRLAWAHGHREHAAGDIRPRVGQDRPGFQPRVDGGKHAAAKALARGVLEVGSHQERIYAESLTGEHAACCSCCRAWTPRERAAPSPTCSRGSTRTASECTRSRRRRPRRCTTFSARSTPVAGPRTARRLRPVALRRCAHRACAPDVARRRDRETVRNHRRLRGGVGPVWHDDHQGHASTSAPKNRRPGCWRRPTTKRWKFNAGDVDERGFWFQYQQAYEIAIQRTTTDNKMS